LTVPSRNHRSSARTIAVVAFALAGCPAKHDSSIAPVPTEARTVSSTPEPARDAGTPASKPTLRVFVDDARLTAVGMSRADLLKTLRSYEIDVRDSGNVDRNGVKGWRLDVFGDPSNSAGLGDLVLLYQTGAPVRIKDIAVLEWVGQ
jgi:hypothetical protein